MNDVQALLDLPITTIATLGAGYVSYKLAYLGQDQTHKAIDIAFVSLTFGLIYKLSVSIASQYLSAPELLIFLGFSITLVCAVIWRKWLRGWVMATLRHTRISYSDGTKSAWDSIRVSTKNSPTQLIVRQKNAPALMCDCGGGDTFDTTL